MTLAVRPGARGLAGCERRAKARKTGQVELVVPTWEARWVRARCPVAAIAESLRSEGARLLPPRDLAYWALVALAPSLDEATSLAGGVAVAAELRHRTSLDLDLSLPHARREKLVASRACAPLVNGPAAASDPLLAIR